MADRRHAVTQLDFFIRQVTLFADEIRNAVGQKLDVLGFKTTGRDLGEQMAFGFLLEFLQKVVVILCDRFACHRIQRLGKILLGETVCIRQALGQGLFHFIGKLPVRRMNLFASSLAYIKEIVKSEFGIPVDANGNALCTRNQISAYGCPLLSCCQNRNILVLCVHKKYVIKTVLMELRCKCQIIPPVVFISDDIGSHDFIYRPQAFIISQRYLTSFLYW